MKVYKLEVFLIDFDELGEEGIREELTNARWPNDCMSLELKNIECRDIGEWKDENPLNHRDTADAEYKRLFKEQ